MSTCARALPTYASRIATAVSGESVLVDILPNLIPPGCEAITPEMLPLVQLSAADIERIICRAPGGTANVRTSIHSPPCRKAYCFTI